MMAYTRAGRKGRMGADYAVMHHYRGSMETALVVGARNHPSRHGTGGSETGGANGAVHTPQNNGI